MAIRQQTESDKAESVKRELDRLEALFSDVNPNKKDFVQRQIEELAWYVVSVADLQRQIDAEGLVVEFQNGKNQSGLQQHPATKTLNDFSKHVISITRTLLPLVPDKTGADELRFFKPDYQPENEEDSDPIDWATEAKKIREKYDTPTENT